MLDVKFSFFLHRGRGPKAYPLHKHDCYEIVYYVDAQGSTFIDGNDFPITAHTVALIPENTPHTDHYSCSSQIYCTGFFSDHSFSPTVITDEDNEFLVLFQEIEKEMKRNANHSNSIINHYIDIILLKILRHNQIPDTDSNIQQRLKYTAQYIKSNCSINIDFQKLAASIGYSYDHFRHLFTEVFGCSPRHYLMTIRIKHAKELLRNTDKNIKTIAFDCGFKQSSQLTAVFVQHEGMTPTSYRNASSIAKNITDL